MKEGETSPGAEATRLTLNLTPHGRLLLAHADDAAAFERQHAQALGEAFARGTGHGLLRLGACDVGKVLPADFGWWREFASRLVTALCARADAAQARSPLVLPEPPSDSELEGLLLSAPMMSGAEYLTVDLLRALWSEIGQAFESELVDSGAALADFLKGLDPCLERRRPCSFQSGGEPSRS